jgi:Arc/MetJ-type ribon-helix-helix transcriptional regulator
MPRTVVKDSSKRKLTTVSFPKGLLDEVDEIVNKNKSKYLNRADFCRSAVRLLLEKETSISGRDIYQARRKEKD